MAPDLRQAFFVKLLGGDHADLVLLGEVEIVFAVDLAAQADLQDAAVFQETFFKAAAERRAVGIFAAKIFVPQIVVRVELDQIDRAALFFRNGAEDRKADAMVAAYAGSARSGGQERGEALLDAAEGVFDRKRIYGKIAEVGDAIFREGIHVQDWIPGADDRGLHSDVARAEARAGAVGSTAVERDADDGDVELFRLRDVRQAHEGWDTGKARVFKGVHRLR